MKEVMGTVQALLPRHMIMMSPLDSFTSSSFKSPMFQARIRTDRWPLTYSNIRHVVGLHRHEIQQIHMVPYRPADLNAAGTLVALLQRAQDLEPGDQRRMVLIDVVFHEHAQESLNSHRHASLVRRYMTRRILLEELGLHPYCQATRQHCLVQVNGRFIPLGSHALFKTLR